MKKIMTIIAAAAVALTLVGCDMLASKAGEGKSSGTKNNKTISVDATGTLATVESGTGAGAEAKYRRFIKELSGNEKTAAIKSTITIPKADLVTDGATDKNVVVGYVFDMNKSWDATANKATTDTATTKLRDFVLFGFSLDTKKAYVEHYSNVNFKDELDTSETTIGSGSDKNIWGDGGWSAALTKGTDYREDDTNFYLDVEVKQETAGTYVFYLGGKKRGEYKASGNFLGTKADGTEGLAVGGIAGYLKCPKGTKAKIIIETDNDDVVGKLFADEE